MSDWKQYVPNNKIQKFKKEFTNIVMTKIEDMLDEACYFGTHHSMYDCNYDNCENCWDDSENRDIRDNAIFFYQNLWNDSFAALDIKPNKRCKIDIEGCNEEEENNDDAEEEN